MGLFSWLGFGAKRSYAAAVNTRNTTWRDSGLSATSEVGAAAGSAAGATRPVSARGAGVGSGT